MIVNVIDAPTQNVDDGPVGVTVMVAVTGIEPVLVAINGVIFPVPLAPKPIETSLFVQLNVEPPTELAKFTAAVNAPLQSCWFAGCTITGIGFTKTLATAVFVQPVVTSVPITV